ncbi:MAG: histidine kinase, partial [Actinobacteria bacterium]|nr:histidine kinase [Actinomycetota bacterium]
MLLAKPKIKQSLGLRVLVINISFALLAVTIIGVSVYSRVSTTVINEKIAISKIETRSALSLTQGHFNISRFQDDTEVRRVVTDFITSVREDGLLSGRDTVILRVPNTSNSKDIYKTIPTVLTEDSIPADFRKQVVESDEVLDMRLDIEYTNGVVSPGFIIGGKLQIPRAGVYEIYFFFNLNAQYQTINSIAWTLFFFGFLLVLLIGLITRFLIRQVVSP